jgi:membrane-bound lytic murein transglycosylase D
MVRRLKQLALLLAAFPFIVACGSTMQGNPPITAPSAPHATRFPEPTVASAPLAPDPVLSLISESEDHFWRGQQELELGHLESAKAAFDRALTVLLEAPDESRAEPRIQDHYEQLLDRISAYQVRALVEGDGFTEKAYEPATIDELLAVSAILVPPPTAADLTSAVEADPVVHDVPIPLNQRVMAFVQLFQGRLREFIQEGLVRGSQYLPMIQGVFRAEGLPLDLAYIPLVESAFKPSALSRAKAKGVWQFMQGTGRENGLRQDWYVDERSDPEKATVAAAKYLTTLSNMFEGDWHLALASYNGGPGRVQRAMRTTRQSDFWKLSARGRLLPRETRDYVPMILAAIIIARNPTLYGFEIDPLPPLAYDTVVLPRPVDLRHIAEWTAGTIDDIRGLNPELRRWTTPVADAEYVLRVPRGTADVVATRLAESEGTDLVSLRWYTVKKGDTLSAIASRLRVSRADLAAANYIRTNSRVTVGQKLIVPQDPTALLTARTDGPAPSTLDARASGTLAPAAAPAATSDSSDRVQLTYQVKRGDTLASIARLFRTTVAALQSWNDISGTTIRAGERLTVFALQTR